MIRNLLLLLAAVVVFPASLLGQDSKFASISSPANWERYRTSDRDLSVLLPKMPLRENFTNPCREIDASTFYAYGEGSVYELGVYAKLPKSAGFKCFGEITPFGEQSMQHRLTALRATRETPAESLVIIDGRSYVKLTTSEWSRWVISDMEDADRWIELAVHHHADENPDFDRFFKSLEFSASSGKEIGRGAEANLGDHVSEKPSAATPVETGGKEAKRVPGAGNGPGHGDAVPTKILNSFPYRVVSQPKARYTDIARKSETQGAVRLKITLLASGSVGSVVVVTELPDGLTDAAVAAAKRIVFLPKRVGNIPASVVVTREYTFTIY